MYFRIRLKTALVVMALGLPLGKLTTEDAYG